MKPAVKPSLLVLLLCHFAIQTGSGAEKLLYTRYTDGNWQVWSSGTEGGSPRQITSSPWDKRSLRADMSAANSVLLRNNEGGLHRLNISTAYDVPMPGANFDAVKDFDFNLKAGFLVASYAPNALDNVCIWLVPGSGERHLLIPDPYLNETPRWLPDASRFLFVKSHAGVSRIWTSSSGTAKSHPLLGEDLGSTSEPCPSPDGVSIAFCRHKDRFTAICACPAAGGEFRELLGGTALKTEPCWSLDSAWIYFAMWDGGHFRIARINSSGRGFQYVTEGGSDCRCPLCLK